MLKVELHTHTKYSYDSTTSLQDVIKACIKKNIDVLAITDHNQIKGALRMSQMAPFRVIVGQEISTPQGEIIGLFLKEFIPGGLSVEKTIKRIKKQGGIVYLPHPFDFTTRKTAFDKKSILQIIDKVDVVEVFNGRTIFPADNKKAQKLASEYKKPKAVGSDAHTRFEFGRNYLEMPDFSNQDEFLTSLAKARKKTSLPKPWVFMLTKWARFRKKYACFGRAGKESIKGRVSCELCGGSLFSVLYEKKGNLKNKYLVTDDSYGAHPQIVKCLDCGLVFVYPRESDKKIEKRYKDFKDPEYEKERGARAVNQRRILTRIDKLAGKKGKLLEVGCATGLFLEMAKNDGWDVFGVEPSSWAAKIAKKKYKLPVFNGTLKEAGLKEKFDVVVLIDVLEHTAKPRKLLLEIAKVLKPKGLLCLVTPDQKSTVAGFLKERWWHVRPDHLYYFSKDTIYSLLFATDFLVKKTERYGWTFSFDYWASRFKNSLPALYKLLVFVKKVPFLNRLAKRDYHFNFRDSFELYCRPS